MSASKLTLSADPQLVADAKHLAKARHTSVSALFARFVTALKQSQQSEPIKLGPVTRRATGLVHVPPKAAYRQLVEDALAEKYSS